MGKKLTIILVILFASSASFAALMPLTDIYTVSEENGADVQSINILDWIKAQNALVTARSNFNVNNYVSVNKMHSGMSDADLGRNILVTTIQNLDAESLEAIKGTLKAVEDVASAKYITDDKSELKVKMDLIRSEAKIEYKGGVDAELTYEISSSEVHLEVSKDFQGTRFLAEHTTSDDEQKNLLGVRWNF